MDFSFDTVDLELNHSHPHCSAKGKHPKYHGHGHYHCAGPHFEDVVPLEPFVAVEDFEVDF